MQGGIDGELRRPTIARDPEDPRAHGTNPEGPVPTLDHGPDVPLHRFPRHRDEAIAAEGPDPLRRPDPDGAGGIHQERGDELARRSLLESELRKSAGAGPNELELLGGEPEGSVPPLAQRDDPVAREIFRVGGIEDRESNPVEAHQPSKVVAQM